MPRNEDLHDDVVFLYWNCKWSVQDIKALYETLTEAEIDRIVRRKVA